MKQRHIKDRTLITKSHIIMKFCTLTHIYDGHTLQLRRIAPQFLESLSDFRDPRDFSISSA